MVGDVGMIGRRFDRLTSGPADRLASRLLLCYTLGRTIGDEDLRFHSTSRTKNSMTSFGSWRE
jgi:hypothetical protein